MKFAHVPATLWFGTDDSHAVYTTALERLEALQQAGEGALQNAIKIYGGGFRDDPFGMPPLWETSGDTAIVHVSGSLVNGSSGFMRLFGVLGYDDIKEAMAEAIAQKDPPKRILLNIDSGGGAVAGVEEMGSFIRQMSAERMPVFSFTAGMMGSAAYWTGASADAVFSTRTAQVGSVGTLIVHMERSKQLAEAGITAKVFRFGKFKALGHPAEPLTAAGEKVLQAMADESGQIFVDYVAERRGVTPEQFQKTMGEGRVFMGREANQVGLTDGVMTMEDVLAHIKTLDTKKPTHQNSRQSAQGHPMKIRALSKAVILALAGGTKVEALGLSAPTANVEGSVPEAEDVTALTAEAGEIQAALTAATTKAVDAAVATVKAPLEASVSNLTAKVALLEAGASDLMGKVTVANESAAACSAVVKASIATMAVALGVADTGATLAGAALMAEHDRLKELFVKKYPAGGVAAVPPGTTATTQTPTAPPAAFLAAAGSWARK